MKAQANIDSILSGGADFRATQQVQPAEINTDLLFNFAGMDTNKTSSSEVFQFDQE